MSRIFGKKRALAALSVVAVLVCAGAAYAYFTSSGSGTGSASVGHSTAFTVAVSPATGSTVLLPGSGTQNLAYTVHNPSTGNQNLSGTTAAVASSGVDVTTGGVDQTGCLASWFTATNTAPTPLPQNLAGGGTSTGGSVAVTMQDSGTNQNACQGVSPDITVSAS
jgi:hypothetical protein